MQHRLCTIFLLTYWLQAGILCSQDLSINTVLQNLNANIHSVSRGVFDIRVQHKTASVEDTFVFAGTVYFFKDHGSQNPYGHFVCFRQGKLNLAFDGYFYQFFNRERKIVRYTVPEHAGLPDLIQENFAMKNGLFLPYLKTDAPAFEFEKHSQFIIDTNLQGLNNTLTLLYQYEHINNIESGPNKPDTVRYEIKHTINLPDYTLRSVTERRYGLESMEYLQLDFSPIRPLPTDTTLEVIINWNNLFKEGYRMVYLNPSAEDE